MIFGLEQEGGGLITPMALAHPLHPIDNRSRNKRRNLWVGRCVSSWWPWFPSGNSVLIYMYIYIYICVHSLYEFCYRSYIQRECHSVLARLHPITFYRGMRGSWSACHFVFSLVYQLCLALWSQPNTRMLVTLCICLKQYFDTRYLVFYNTSLPRMFLSLDLLWEYRIQHGATDPFMSHLATQLGYSAGEFQALQLIVLATFGVVD